jgi:hypothetical protein
MLGCLDVTLDINVYVRPERSQRGFSGEKVVHQLFVMPPNEIACRLDVHVLCLHQHGNSVVAFHPTLNFLMIGKQVLGLKRGAKEISF